MKILQSGSLSGVTGLAWGSGVSTPPIDISNERNIGSVDVWLQLTGDMGHSNSSASVIWKASYQKGGTYVSGSTGQYLVKSGTSKTGFLSNGSYLKSILTTMPFLRIEARVSKAGTTNNLAIDYAISGM